MAPVGPNCNGITRTLGLSEYAREGDLVKTSGFGHTPIDPERILNIWVCNLSNGLLGYAQFPSGGPIETDGVVIDYKAFGTTGTAESPFDLGITATHEVGHYFGLRHIWGDDQGESDKCSGTDFDDETLDDTPNQEIMNFYCPSFPHISCENGPNGDLYMNYMDYTDDACMYMFTHGQASLMLLELTVARSGLLDPYEELSISMEKTDPYCGPNSGSASVTAEGGSTPYTYIWSNGETTSSIENLSGGTYIVTVTDASGCSKVKSIYLQPEYYVQPDSPNWSSVVAQNNLDNELLLEGHVYVEGTLYMDIDYTFAGVSFRMAPNSVIIVNDGVKVNIVDGLNQSRFEACNGEWEGIVVEKNARLTMRYSIVSYARNSITGQNNSFLDLQNNTFEYFENGLNLDGDVEIHHFSGNDFKYGYYGVKGRHSENMLNLAGIEKSRNHFSFVTTGTKLG